MEQMLIAVTGVTAIWLSQDKRDKYRKYACLFGISAQPFWFYSAYQAEQWGIFILCFFYSYAWMKGVNINWIQPYLQRRKT